MGDAGAGDREAEQLAGATLEADQAHHHPQEQRQEAPPPRLAGDSASRSSILPHFSRVLDRGSDEPVETRARSRLLIQNGLFS